MSDLIFKTKGKETFRIPFPTPGTKCPETKLEIKMTEKTIQLNLTEEQFNMIWNALVLSEDEMVDEGDIRVRIETLNEMEDIMEELGLEVFGDVNDD